MSPVEEYWPAHMAGPDVDLTKSYQADPHEIFGSIGDLTRIAPSGGELMPYGALDVSAARGEICVTQNWMRTLNLGGPATALSPNHENGQGRPILPHAGSSSSHVLVWPADFPNQQEYPDAQSPAVDAIVRLFRQEEFKPQEKFPLAQAIAELDPLPPEALIPPSDASQLLVWLRGYTKEAFLTGLVVAVYLNMVERLKHYMKKHFIDGIGVPTAVPGDCDLPWHTNASGYTAKGEWKPGQCYYKPIGRAQFRYRMGAYEEWSFCWGILKTVPKAPVFVQLMKRIYSLYQELWYVITYTRHGSPTYLVRIGPFERYLRPVTAEIAEEQFVQYVAIYATKPEWLLEKVEEMLEEQLIPPSDAAPDQCPKSD